MRNDIDLGLPSGPVDYGLSAFKALLSLGPGGGLVAELISAVIPEQRADRMARYLTALADRFNRLEAAALNAGARSMGPEQVSLFHAGGEAAVRAPHPDRVERIAKVVAQGMAGSELEAARARRMVEILSDLSEDDVVQLCGHVEPFKSDADWRELHGATLWTGDYRGALLARRTPHDEMARLAAAVDLQIFRLIRLGLLEDPPQLDLHDVAAQLSAYEQNIGLARYGVSKPALATEPSEPRLSPLGRMVLEELGLVAPPASQSPSTGKEWDAMEAAREEG